MKPKLAPETPRSVYVHVPFCRHRCGYCNFTLVAGRDDLVDSFLDALAIELQQYGKTTEVDTIYLGGGTPTHLNVRQLRRLFELLRKWFPLTQGGEWSCEANPLDCVDEKLALLLDSGVNRISIGGQSFDDRKLSLLERDHCGRDLETAIAATLDYFDNVSLDLIFAAPGETLGGWQKDLQSALASGVTHLSTYGMTIEKGSAFYGRLSRAQFAEVDEEVQLAMYLSTIEQSAQAGWEHYEISSFAKQQRRCRHNEVYWTGRSWLAFGPGAARFVDGWRTVNHRSTTQYIRLLQKGCSPTVESEQLTSEQRLRENFVFGLRRLEGVDLRWLSQQWGSDAEQQFQPALDEFIKRGWLCRSDSRISLTRSGLVISDSLWPKFLSEKSKP